MYLISARVVIFNNFCFLPESWRFLCIRVCRVWWCKCKVFSHNSHIPRVMSFCVCFSCACTNASVRLNTSTYRNERATQVNTHTRIDCRYFYIHVISKYNEKKNKQNWRHISSCTRGTSQISICIVRDSVITGARNTHENDGQHIYKTTHSAY